MQKFLEALLEPMAVVGLIGQGLFFSRFLVQWIVSEKKGRSEIPHVFWLLSLGGGALLFIYAVWRGEPIFAVGQGTGLIVYARNLVLIRREGAVTRARALTTGNQAVGCTNRLAAAD